MNRYLFLLSAAIFGLVWLAFILGSLISQGVAALSPTLFTESTPPPGSAGGLANAIVGSVLMSVLPRALRSDQRRWHVQNEKVGHRNH